MEDTILIVNEWIRSARAISESENAIEGFKDPTKNFVQEIQSEKETNLLEYLELLPIGSVPPFTALVKQMLKAGSEYIIKLQRHWQTRGPALLQDRDVNGLTMNNQECSLKILVINLIYFCFDFYL